MQQAAEFLADVPHKQILKVWRKVLTHSCSLILAEITYNLSGKETEGFRQVFNRQNRALTLRSAKKVVSKSWKRKQVTVISSLATVLQVSTDLREKSKVEPNSVVLFPYVVIAVLHRNKTPTLLRPAITIRHQELQDLLMVPTSALPNTA